MMIVINYEIMEKIIDRLINNENFFFKKDNIYHLD